MHLALRRARPDRPPGNQVRNVLRRNHVQEFAPRRQAQAVDVQQQLARHAHALVDVEAAVQVRVVDQPLPTDRGAGLLEIHAHHDFQVRAETVTHRLQALRVFDRGAGVVDRTRADHDDHAVVHAVQDAMHRLAGGEHGVGSLLGAGELAHHVRGRVQLFDFSDAKVVGIV